MEKGIAGPRTKTGRKMNKPRYLEEKLVKGKGGVLLFVRLLFLGLFFGGKRPGGR